ncbi:MAG TPA: hypothetical protein VK610_06615 [Rhodothermales bacterium]|nr:hypothetical protein [Rhodothermales bacterium]
MGTTLINYSVYFLAAAGWFVAYLQFRQRHKAEVAQIHLRDSLDEARALRERRSAVYSEYFAKVDRLNSQLYLAQTSEEMEQETRRLMAALTEWSARDRTPEAEAEVRGRYAAIMEKHWEIMRGWVKESNTLLDELNRVRFIGSSDVVALLDRYTASLEALLTSCALLPVQMILAGPGQFDLEQALNYARATTELRVVTRELHAAMRKDVGVQD